MSAHALFNFSLSQPYSTVDPEHPVELCGSTAWFDFESGLDQLLFGSTLVQHTPPLTAVEEDGLDLDTFLLSPTTEPQTVDSPFSPHPLLGLGPSSPAPRTAIPDASTPQPRRVPQPSPKPLELAWLTPQPSAASSPVASDLLTVNPFETLQDFCDFTALFGLAASQPAINCKNSQLSPQPSFSTDWLRTLPSTPTPTARELLSTALVTTPTPPILSRTVDSVMPQTLSQEAYLRELLGLYPSDMTKACFRTTYPPSTLPVLSPHTHSRTYPVPENCSRKRKRSDYTVAIKKRPRLSTADTPPLGHRVPQTESASRQDQLDQQHDQRTNSKRSGAKRLTDSAHYRARNAFFMFRGFVSRIQCTIPCKSASHSACASNPTVPYMRDSKRSLSSTPRPQVTGQPQTKVSASDYLKLRQAHIERRIEFHAAGDDQTGPWVDIPLEDTFQWTEFQQLYQESDLFKWHRENYLAQDGVLDVEGLKRIWVENEQSYEQTFTQAARWRIVLELSGNRRKSQPGWQHARPNE
ncbi:unnamed protein product [Mortierella alpina]